MRILIKERNKLAMLSRCVGQIIENNLSETSPLVAYLLMKNLYLLSELFKKNLENLS